MNKFSNKAAAITIFLLLMVCTAYIVTKRSSIWQVVTHFSTAGTPSQLSSLKHLKKTYDFLDKEDQQRTKLCLLTTIGQEKMTSLIEKWKTARTLDTQTLNQLQSCLLETTDNEGAVAEKKDSNTPSAFEGELVKPAERDPEKWGTARCNDGTPFAFKIEKPKNKVSNEWVVYLQGGGMCDDNALDCRDRLQDYPQRTTTLAGKDGQKYSIIGNAGIFNHDPDLNPEFYNANKVYAHYCSSDGWSGTTADRITTTAGPVGWYFSGQLNATALFEILKEEYGLNDSNQKTKILLSGGSAGCFGANINAEQATKLFPNAAQDGRLKIISDGCYMPHFDNPTYRVGKSGESIEAVLIKAHDFWHAEVNSACERSMKAQGKPAGSCYMGDELIHYTTSCSGDGLCLSNLVQYSSIDHWAVLNHGIDPKASPNNTGLEQWRSTALKELEKPEITWLFSGGNISYHTLLMEDAMWQYGDTNGQTFGNVLVNFWNDKPARKVIFGNP